MSHFVSAADKYTPSQFGENGNIEFGYSNRLDEKIVQFFFQLIRTDNTVVLEKQLFDMLNFIKGNEKQYFKQLSLLFRIIAQTRDIVSGKGEYNLSFMQIFIWWQFYLLYLT